jgi:hypothetical protein
MKNYIPTILLKAQGKTQAQRPQGTLKTRRPHSA